MLKGAELLNKLNELDGMPVSDQAKVCGYVSTGKNGKPRVNFTAFYKACAEARGQAFTAGTKLAGRELAYGGKAGTAGQVMVGARYAEMIGIKPGDRFEIEVDSEDAVIVISKASKAPATAPTAVAAVAV